MGGDIDDRDGSAMGKIGTHRMPTQPAEGGDNEEGDTSSRDY